MVEDWNSFLTNIQKIKSYIVKFNENGIIKAKVFFVNSVVGDKEYCSIIIITHDKYIIFVNNKV